MPQPPWGWVHRRGVPKVARSSQPWVEGHNPVGIEKCACLKNEMRPAWPFLTPPAVALPRPPKEKIGFYSAPTPTLPPGGRGQPVSHTGFSCVTPAKHARD